MIIVKLLAGINPATTYGSSLKQIKPTWPLGHFLSKSRLNHRQAQVSKPVPQSIIALCINGSFFFDLTGRFSGQRQRSYETTHSWDSEPQPATSSAVSNIEQEISNDEVWNRCAQSFDYKMDRIHYSMLDVGSSMFDVH
jgi:hypothetical protein